MAVESAIGTNQPLSDDVEISARTSALVVALCWTAFFTEGYDVCVPGAILPALATDASWKLTPIELGTVLASLILISYLAAFVRSAGTGFALSFARIRALLGPLLGGYIASLAVGPQWNFHVFVEVAAVAAVATALIPKK